MDAIWPEEPLEIDSVSQKLPPESVLIRQPSDGLNIRALYILGVILMSIRAAKIGVSLKMNGNFCS